MTRPLVAKDPGATRKALRDARLEWSEVKGVVMVGGATRMPHVQQMVADFSARRRSTISIPDKVVALGAAIQANVLAGNKASGDDWLLLDVIPLSARHRDHGRPRERVHPAQFHDPRGARAGIHHLTRTARPR